MRILPLCLSLSLLTAFGHAAAASSQSASAPSSQSAAANPFGISGIPLSHPDQLERASKLGMTQVFVDVDKNEAAQLDAFLSQAAKAKLLVFAGLNPADASLGADLAKRASGKLAGLSFGPVDPANTDQVKAAEMAFAAVRQVAPELPLILELASIQSPDTKQAWSAIAVPLMGNSADDMKALAAMKSATQLPIWSFRVGIPQPAQGDIVAEGETMRAVVQRYVEALSAGVQKVFWSDFNDENNDGIGFYAFDGKKMRMSFPAFRYMASRIYPFESIEPIEQGPEYFGYKFHQVGGQTTTVAWTSPKAKPKTWNEHLKGDFRIYDICGSVINIPATQTITIQPLYYIEHPSPAFPKVTYNEGSFKIDEREFPYQRMMPASSPVEVKEGWDWTLPENVEPEPQSGFFNFSNQPSKDIRIVGWHPLWKNWSVGPGKYDFTSMRDLLARAKKENFKVGIRLQSVVQNTVPPWIIQKYNPPTAMLSSGQRLTIVAPWDENVRREFEAMIKEFGKQGFQNDPNFAWASIHGIGLALGEEFDLPEKDTTNLEKVAGLTHEKFQAWVLGRINAWADAFGEKHYKLGWVGGEKLGSPKYDDVATAAIDLCLQRGVGARGGFIEMYNYKWNERLWGSSRSEDGYMLVDENRFKDNLMMADENEEYKTVKRWRFGLLEEDPHRWRLSNLRALQMRINFLNTNSASMDLDRQLTEYIRRELGRNAENAPDAWCYLREAFVKDAQSKMLPLKNFERWLLQRDLPGGMTQPADRLERTYAMTTDPEGMHYEFNARRTDLASGNKYIYFNLDDRIRPASAVVKVTYLDNAKSAFALEYNGKGKADQGTEPVECMGDGKVKTATFTLKDCDFGNKLENEQDLRLVCNGPSDVTVHMVRLIKGE